MPQKASPLSMTLKQGFAAIQKQWMALLVTYHPNFQAESAPQIIYFGGF